MKNLLLINLRIFYSAIFLLSILLLLAACSPSGPTVTPGHNLLYALTFDNEAAFFGWHVGAPGQYEWLKNTQDGKYLFEYPSGFLESQDFDFADVQISVDVEFLVKSRVEVGLACRMQANAGGRYYFNISNDGRWSITNGETILAEGWSDQIKPDKDRLAARCVGDQLTLLVNGVELGSAQDKTYVSGSLNFSYAADAAGSGTFDNITVEDWGDGKTQQVNLAPVEGSTPTQGSTSEPAAPSPTPFATATPSRTPTPAATLVPSPTPEGLFYANHFDTGSSGLDGWTTYEIINTRHGLPDDSNIELVNQRLRLNNSNSQPLYLIYDASFPVSGWNMSMKMGFHEPGNAGIAFVCQYSQSGWYELGFKTDGSWQIKRADNTSETGVIFSTLAEGTSPAIQTEENLMEVSCIQENLSLVINGQVIGTAIDSNPLQGNVYGLVYQEDGTQSIYTDISEIHLTAPDGKKIQELTNGANSFYFSLSSTAVSYGLPQNVRSIIPHFSQTQLEDGRLSVNLDTSGQWYAISSQVFPANIEFSADIDTSDLDGYSFGVGLICRWKDLDGGYALWYVDGRFMTTPIWMESGFPKKNGAAEFFKDDTQKLLTGGTQHHVTARCWNDLVEMSVDGKSISSYNPASFPYVGNYKTGNQVGLIIFSDRDRSAKVFFDNLLVSWNMENTVP